MKPVLTLVLSLLFIAVTNAQQPGTLDKSFGDSGKVIVPYGVTNMTMQADGKIVTIGGSGFFNIVLFNNNGSLDKTFGNNGIVNTAFSWTGTKGNGVAVQKDGKIVAVGCTAGDPFFYGTDFALARYLPDGTLDSSFGVDGKVITGIDTTYSSETFQSVAILSDGKIICGGNQGGYFALMRFNLNGSIDSSFGINGLSVMKDGGAISVYTMGIEPDGRIILGGIKQAYYYNFTMACFNSNGTVDSAFGLNGIVTTHFGTHTDVGYGAMVVQSDGKIVFKESNREGTVIIARFKPDGNFDPTFAQKGILVEENSWIYRGALCVQEDGKIVSAGELSKGAGNNALVVKRYKVNGDIDSSFGNNGTTKIRFYDVPYAYEYFTNSSVLQKNNDIIFGGYLLTRYHGDASRQPPIVRIKRWLQHHGISWNTLQGANISYYLIQRSTDGITFKDIARVNNTITNYEDAAQPTGNAYYRIIAVDKIGNRSYSNVILITPISIYPNPVKNYLHVQGLSSTSKTILSIVDMNGGVRSITTVNSPNATINIAKLPADNYMLKVEEESTTITLPFLKE